MPRDVEHIVATHQLAQARRNAGQPIWERTLDVSDVFHNDALTFPEIRDAVVARIKNSPWYQNRDTTGFDEFGEHVEELAHVENADDFDEFWDAIYDQADYDRVWIKTS